MPPFCVFWVLLSFQGDTDKHLWTELGQSLITLQVKYDFHFIKFPIKDRELEKSRKLLVFPWKNYEVSIQEIKQQSQSSFVYYLFIWDN